MELSVTVFSGREESQCHENVNNVLSGTRVGDEVTLCNQAFHSGCEHVLNYF